jgi:hypothetical protein
VCGCGKRVAAMMVATVRATAMENRLLEYLVDRWEGRGGHEVGVDASAVSCARM